MKNVVVSRSRMTVGMRGLKNTLDDSVMAHEYAASASGFSFDKGVLTAEIGLDVAKSFATVRAELPSAPNGEAIEQVFFYRFSENGTCKDKILIRTASGGKMYIADMYGDVLQWQQLNAVASTGEVSSVCYNYKGEDIILLASETQPLFVIKKGTAQVCETAPRFSCVETHNERIFGGVNSDEISLWFSDDFDPVNWQVSLDGAGYVSFADDLGKIIKLASFGGYLYIFREYGVFRLTAIGDQSEFVLKKVFIDTGHINKRSILTTGDKMIFLSDNGLYAFDGYSLTRVAPDLPDIDNNGEVCAAYMNSEYFLACTLSDGQRVLLRYDLRTGETATLFVNIADLCTVTSSGGREVFCAIKGKSALGMMSRSGQIFGENTKKVYKSPVNSLGTPVMKTVRSVSLETKFPVDIGVILDGKKYSYHIDGSDKYQTISVEKCGVKLGFEITANTKDAHITPLSVQLDAMKTPSAQPIRI